MIPRELLRQLRAIEIRTQRLADEQLAGSYHSVFKGQGLSFQEVRAYVPGDDVRFIDWNVSARMDAPYVKVFVEEREMTVMLVVDLSASERWGTVRAPKARVAAEVGALCAFSAIKNRDNVGLVLATDVIEKLVPPKKGDKHVMRVISEIINFKPKYTGTNLALALQTLVRVTRRKSVAFVISDFFASGFERELALASAKHDLIPVMLIDPRDEQLVDVGVAAFEDFETGEEILVDTSDRRARQHSAPCIGAPPPRRAQLVRTPAPGRWGVRPGGSFVAPIRKLCAKRARRLGR